MYARAQTKNAAGLTLIALETPMPRSRNRWSSASTYTLFLSAACVVYVPSPPPAAAPESPQQQEAAKTKPTGAEAPGSAGKVSPTQGARRPASAAAVAKPVVRRARRPPRPPTGVTQVLVVPPPTAGITASDLGTPFGADFSPIVGAAGATLFPKAQSLGRIEHREYHHDLVAIDTEQAFSAWLSGWGATLDGGTARSQRHVVFYASELVACEQVDDRTAMRQPPAGAHYYLARVCYGSRLDERVSGDSRSFHAGLKASLFGFGGGFKAFASENKLTHAIQSIGLQRRQGCNAITFPDPAAFQECFGDGGSDGQTIVLVEWRTIPGRTPPRKGIAWGAAPRLANCGGTREDCRPCQRWRFDRVTFDVPSAKSDWGGSAGQSHQNLMDFDRLRRDLRGGWWL